MRLIDADALKEDFDCVGFNDYDDYTRALRIIDDAPTVEPKKDEIRWTDKVTLDADGNIRDFNGNIYGADMRGDV